MLAAIKRFTGSALPGMIVLLGLAACGGQTGVVTQAPTAQPAEATAEPTMESAPTATGPALPAEPLQILEWSGYEATSYPEFFAPFTQKYGDNLDSYLAYSFFAEDAEAYTKLSSGFHADVVHPCNSWWSLYVQNGLVQPIDTSRLSNWPGVNADLAQMGQFEGQQYFIPWEWGYESILVRTDLVQQVPTSWADLWDPQYSGHVAIWDNAETSFVMTALALGFDPWNTTPDQQDQIKQKLIDLKSHLLTYWTDFTQLYELPTTGDAWLIANAWQDAYGNVKDDYPVAYIQPTEGRLGWVCGYGITADANPQEMDLIYEFLDAAIAPESMAALGNTYWYGFSNMDALPLVDETVTQLMELDQVDTLTQRTVFYKPLTDEQRQMMNNIWADVKAAP